MTQCKGIIDAEQLERLAQPLTKNGYGRHLLSVFKEPVLR
jgi:glucose-1-phosphate thymidylyltransferase